jgi:tetratricopeptide (TPR) repeat protein
MTSRVRWLLVIGILLIAVVAGFSLSLPSGARPTVTTTAHQSFKRLIPVEAANAQPLSDAQLNQFLAAAREAETITNLLQRCLSYPNPPGLAWSKAVTSAYCHYQFDPAVTPEDARKLIQNGHAEELDRRLAAAMHAQSSQPDAQGVLDRTFIIDFRNGSEETRALIDAWKRQLPASPFALAASGTAYVQMAQEMRGSDVARKTPQSSFESMDRLLELARADLDKAATLQPNLTATYTAMIYAAALESDGSYAMSAAKRGLAVDPANYTIYARLVWMAQPKWGGTVEDMQRIIASAQRHANENPLLRLILSENSGGEAYVESCDCNPITELELYRRVFAEAAPVNMLMSGGWAAKNRNSSALSVIYRSQVIRFDPSKLDHREGRAFDLPSLGQSDWALAEGNALIALAPQDENAFDVRGLAYESTGNFIHAIDDYEQALRLNPADAWTLAELGNLYVRSGQDWDKGWAVANRLIQMSPDNPQGWLLRASIQKNQPRDGLDQTISDFVARFGNDPGQRGPVARMQAMRPQ